VSKAARVPPADPDLELRRAAVKRARELAQAYGDLVPLDRLREGFQFGGQRISYGSFQRASIARAPNAGRRR
jgi:hypothetical protein